jgi:signal transduction histidine kinase
MNRDFDNGPHALAGALPYAEATPEPVGVWFRGFRRVIDEGRRALDGLLLADPGSTGLERALAELADEIAPAGTRVRICVLGRARQLPPNVSEEVSSIALEALRNALRHSQATRVEVEVEYLSGRLRLVVRDNGIGISREVLARGRGFHWGLTAMRECAAHLGAHLRLLSRTHGGTEVEVSVPTQLSFLYAPAGSPAGFERRAAV